ncbi:MAG: bifunctional metallophosphatase/5'-nucleotidase [Rhodothermales bacterium]
MMRSLLAGVLALRLLAGCGAGPAVVAPPVAAPASPVVRVNILQINDVYEVAPQAGAPGGLARVAALRDSLLRETPSTFTVIAGDFISPSALGTARVDGERLAGRQMVDMLNAVGVNYATFGNHEFDLGYDVLRRRMEEAGFTWISSNVTDTLGEALSVARASEVIAVPGPAGVFRIGLVGATLAENDPDYAAFAPPIEALREVVGRLRPRVDAVIAITHVDYQEDLRIATGVEGIDLIIGGHEHENVATSLHRNGRMTRVAKADANALSAYVHRLAFDTRTSKLTITSELVVLGDDRPEHAGVAARAASWQERAYAGFRQDGFEPAALVGCSTEALDGRESAVRNGPTNLTRLIVEAMQSEVPDARLALFNSGSIRVDDVLQPGRLTQYDVLRTLPYQGRVLAVDMPGRLLISILQRGAFLRGTGGYLQWTDNVSEAASRWMLDGEPITLDRTYRVAVNDYLANGLQNGLELFDIKVAGDDQAHLVATYRDLRNLLVDAVQMAYPLNAEGDCTP